MFRYRRRGSPLRDTGFGLAGGKKFLGKFLKINSKILKFTDTKLY